jgi:signal transduction histidine kinase
VAERPRRRPIVAALGRRLGTVRARATLAAVVVVGAAFAIGALGLLDLLHDSLQEGVETTVQTQLSDVATLVRLGQLPAQLPGGRGDTFTQVVGPDGQVLATTASLLITGPISHRPPAGDGTVIASLPALTDLDATHAHDPEGPYLLVGRAYVEPAGANHPARVVTVYVAGSLRPVVEATNTVGVALAAGLPVLLALVGALVWAFCGRALRPVEGIRAEVADITGHDLHRRVPEPATADEIARLARTMNLMLDRLEASADAQLRFVADASHELRSPLAVLQATLELAQAHPGAPWPVADALDETQRLRRLVDDLLTLAHNEQNPHQARFTTVDLDEIIFREARQLRTTTTLTVDTHAVSGGRVQGDHDQLTRVVRNLFDNAQRHASTTVTVQLTTGGDDSITLVVADDGPGIPAAERHRVFERFARLDEARNQHDGGSGLGLAITKEIITNHAGTIEVAESPSGARLVVRLPGSDTAATQDGRRHRQSTAT